MIEIFQTFKLPTRLKLDMYIYSGRMLFIVIRTRKTINRYTHIMYARALDTRYEVRDYRFPEENFKTVFN